MSSVSNILNSNHSSRISTNRFKEYEDASKCAQSDDRSRYNTLSEYQEAGLLARYNVIKRDLIKDESYKVLVNIAKEKLGQEELIIKDIRDALNECDRNSSQQDQVLGTIEERANQALRKVQEILNRKDSNGQYILGGINPSKQPCEDFVALSNIEDGVPSANYTEVTPNKREMQISDRNKVTFGLCASEIAFRQVIATINQIKLGNNEAAADLKQQALKSLDLLELINGENTEQVNQAQEYSEQLNIRLHKELEDIFSIPRVEAIQKQTDSMQALLESMTLMTKQHKLDDAFNQVF